MKNLIHLNEQGWYWPNADIKGHGGAWFDLAGQFAETPEKIAAASPNKKVLVQAGGNCGLYIKKFAKLFDHVYTFEPDPVNFYCLNLNVTEPNVYKYQAALGFHRIPISTRNDAPFNVGASYVAAEGNIPTLRIDDLGLKECSAIQLDIEGFELFALQGAEETIKRCNPIIVVEFGWEHRYGVRKSDIQYYLEALNYECRGEIPGAQADILYCPK